VIVWTSIRQSHVTSYEKMTFKKDMIKLIPKHENRIVKTKHEENGSYYWSRSGWINSRL